MPVGFMPQIGTLFDLGREEFTEMVEYPALHRLFIYLIASEFRKAGDTAVGDTAWHNMREVAQVGVDVECEAVHGHPARTADPHGADLLTVDPDTGQPLNPARLHTPVGTGPDDHRLQQTEILVDIGKVAIQVENGITDNLTEIGRASCRERGEIWN